MSGVAPDPLDRIAEWGELFADDAPAKETIRALVEVARAAREVVMTPTVDDPDDTDWWPEMSTLRAALARLDKDTT